MTTSFHTKIAGIAAAVVIVAVSAPSAVGAPGGPHARSQLSINYVEPGSTGYVPQRFSLRYTEPGSTGFVPVAETTVAASAFDWASALIGAGAGLGIAVACAGGLTAMRRRRGLAHA